MSKMIIVSGDKGGAGKTTVASVAIDAYRRHHPDLDLLIVESDGVVADVMERYTDTGIPGALAPMEGDPTDAVAALVDHLSAHPADRVVINLPASACTTIDPMADELLAPAAQALGLEIVGIHVLTADPSSSRLAGRSLDSGLLSIADQKIAVLNGHFGPVERFAWSQSPGRQAFLSAGGIEAWLPDLHPRVAGVVTDHPYGDYLPGGKAAAELTLANRILLQRWLQEADKIVEIIEAGAAGEEVAA